MLSTVPGLRGNRRNKRAHILSGEFLGNGPQQRAFGTWGLRRQSVAEFVTRNFTGNLDFGPVKTDFGRLASRAVGE